VIIYNLDLGRPLTGPRKTEAVLIVDADAVLTFKIPRQGFQVIAGRSS